MFELILVLISIGAGTLGSVLGLGGGILIIPLLTILFGIRMRYAIGASIVSVLATSSGTAFHDKGTFMNLRLAVFLSIATAVGGWVGAEISSMIDQKYLFVIFLVVLLVSIPLTLRDLPPIHLAEPAKDSLAQRLRLNSAYSRHGQTTFYSVSNVFFGFLLMSGIGVITGMLGIGAGAFRIPIMDRVMRVPLKVSVSTSNLMIGITSAVSAGTFLAKGNVLTVLAAPVGLGVLIGTRSVLDCYTGCLINGFDGFWSLR